jgi:hypothetical protein
VPFDVVGLSLRYRAPFQGFVDELEPAGDGYLGRATFHGREFGRFALEPSAPRGASPSMVREARRTGTSSPSSR